MAATAEQFAGIAEIPGQMDAVLVRKPAGMSGEDLRHFLFDGLARFRDLNLSHGELPPKPVPGSGEIDPAYFQPPFAFTEAQFRELMKHLEAPETEVRRDAYPDSTE